MCRAAKWQHPFVLRPDQDERMLLPGKPATAAGVLDSGLRRNDGGGCRNDGGGACRNDGGGCRNDGGMGRE